jgi:hypothetical protein
MPSNQVVTIGKQTYPITYREGGPTITGVFTPEQKRYITSVYGVKILNPPQVSRPTPKR